jgi:hypothetical protein
MSSTAAAMVMMSPTFWTRHTRRAARAMTWPFWHPRLHSLATMTMKSNGPRLPTRWTMSWEIFSEQAIITHTCLLHYECYTIFLYFIHIILQIRTLLCATLQATSIPPPLTSILHILPSAFSTLFIISILYSILYDTCYHVSHKTKKIPHRYTHTTHPPTSFSRGCSLLDASLF